MTSLPFLRQCRRWPALLALLVCALPVWAQSSMTGQIGISPENFILDATEAGRTQSYRLHNMGGAPVQLRVELAPFTLDEKNAMVLLPPDATSLDQWTVINPVELDIPAGESRAVRFAIRPATPMTAGEHRMAIIFQELPGADTPAADGDPASAGLSMRMLFRIQSAIYVTEGPVTRRGELLDVRLDADGLWTEIRSSGDAHLRADAQLQIWREGQFPGIERALADPPDAPTPAGRMHRGQLSRIPVLPGQVRWIGHPVGDLPLAAGAYTVFMHGTLGDSTLSDVRTLRVAAR